LIVVPFRDPSDHRNAVAAAVGGGQDVADKGQRIDEGADPLVRFGVAES
jgi:hypothetical protein